MTQDDWNAVAGLIGVIIAVAMYGAIMKWRAR